MQTLMDFQVLLSGFILMAVGLVLVIFVLITREQLRDKPSTIGIRLRMWQLCHNHPRSSIILLPLLFLIGMSLVLSVGVIMILLGETQIIISLIVVWFAMLIASRSLYKEIGRLLDSH